MSSIYQIEQKTFIEASCTTSNKQTGERVFRSFYFQRKVCELFLLKVSKKRVVYFGLYESSLRFETKEN